MPDDEPSTQPAWTSAPDEAGIVELVELSPVHRRALKNGRMSMWTYLKVVPSLAVFGEIALWNVVIIRGRNIPDLGAMIVVPVLFILIFHIYFVIDRMRTRADLHGGTYARYTGPMRIAAESRSESKGKTHTYYKLVLGTFKTISLKDSDGRRLQPLVAERGQADVAVHANQLLEVRNEAGLAIFRADGLRKALGKASV